MSGKAPYALDEQIGFILRQVYQRHASLFSDSFGEDFTPMQWAVVAKLAEVGDCSQNMLGRHTAMDVATIKGVVERLMRRGLIETKSDAADRRRLVVSLTANGRAAFERWSGPAAHVSDETLAPLPPEDQQTLLRLLTRLR